MSHALLSVCSDHASLLPTVIEQPLPYEQAPSPEALQQALDVLQAAHSTLQDVANHKRLRHLRATQVWLHLLFDTTRTR